MVQFINLPQSRKSIAKEMLGESLGSGLGNMLGDYFANKAAESVIGNKSLQNAPLSERHSALERALAPHGQRGENLLQRRLGIEQQRQQEQESIKNQRIQSNLHRMLSGEQLTPEESSEFPPQFQIAAHKAMQPKAPPGGISSQPVPPEVSQSIGNILGQSKGLTADELAQQFDQSAIPRAYSNSYIVNRRRQDEASPKERLEIHKLSSDIAKKINEEGESSKKRLRAFDTMEKNLASGKLDPKNFRNFLANSLQGTTLEGLLRSPESEEFKAATFNTYEGLKNVFGTRLSDADLRLASTKVPDITKKPESNMKIIKFLKFFDEMNVNKQKISDQILKENSGYRPIDFDQQVRERLESEFGDEAEKVVKDAARSELTGKIIDVIGPDGSEYEIDESEIDQLPPGFKTK